MLEKIGYAARWLVGRAQRGGRPITLLGLDDPSPADAVVDAEQEKDIMRRLAAMPVMVREIYLLRMVDKMSIEQIAYALAISRREARENLRRAIAFLLP